MPSELEPPLDALRFGFFVAVAPLGADRPDPVGAAASFGRVFPGWWRR